MSAEDEPAAALEEARRRIAAWSPGETLDLSEIWVLDRLPDEIAELRELRALQIFGTRVADLGPLQGLANLEALFCGSTRVAGLAPLKRLANLRWLNCARTQVADLAPLQGVVNLKHFDCWDTRVADLAPRVPAIKVL